MNDKRKLSPDVVTRYFVFIADLEIRVAALEDIVLEQSTSIQSLQETDVELEQRVEDLEDYIIGESLQSGTEVGKVIFSGLSICYHVTITHDALSLTVQGHPPTLF